MMARSLKDKVVLITGASSGIGEATARLLAKDGARLALAARREDRLLQLKAELEKNNAATVLVIPTDVRRPEDLKNMIEKTHGHFGRIDVLINNAGVLYMQSVLEMPLDDVKNMLDTNFWPLIHTVRLAAPLMEKQGGGQIINVGSGAGRRGLPFMAAYSGTKFALTGLTEALRVELAPRGIVMTLVQPGGVETEMPESVSRDKLPPDYPPHLKGITAERVAKALRKAIQCQSPEIFVPRWVALAAYVSVIGPRLGDFILRKTRMPRGHPH